MVHLFTRNIHKYHSGISGKLRIDGDTENNYLFIRFYFDTKSMIKPILVKLEAKPLSILRAEKCNKIKHLRQSEKKAVIICNVFDHENSSIIAEKYSTNFNIKEHKIKIISIEPQVSGDI